MAGQVQISIKDRESATAWLQTVEQINEDYRIAMKDAGDCLVNMQDFADGTLVDEFVKFGTDILNAAETTFNVINTIATTVNKILDTVTNFTENIVGNIGNAIGKIFG